MASKAKVNKQANNILYLQDADAKVLGIIEGSSQRVFVDNREVEVVFVDEHEVIPVSVEDKKLYQEAYKIAAKYAEESKKGTSPASKALVARSGRERPIREREYRSGNSNFFMDKWSSLIDKFRRDPEDRLEREQFRKEREQLKREREEFKRERANSKAMIKYQESKQPRHKEPKSRYGHIADNRHHAKHSIRNHVFTNEELEIIQSVIDKTRYANNMSSDSSRKQTNNSKIKSKRK